jgi:hypothetical protein
VSGSTVGAQGLRTSLLSCALTAHFSLLRSESAEKFRTRLKAVLLILFQQLTSVSISESLASEPGVHRPHPDNEEKLGPEFRKQLQVLSNT